MNKKLILLTLTTSFIGLALFGVIATSSNSGLLPLEPSKATESGLEITFDESVSGDGNATLYTKYGYGLNIEYGGVTQEEGKIGRFYNGSYIAVKKNSDGVGFNHLSKVILSFTCSIVGDTNKLICSSNDSDDTFTEFSEYGLYAITKTRTLNYSSGTSFVYFSFNLDASSSVSLTSITFTYTC